jgi:hypothetical protein
VIGNVMSPPKRYCIVDSVPGEVLEVMDEFGAKWIGEPAEVRERNIGLRFRFGYRAIAPKSVIAQSPSSDRSVRSECPRGDWWRR